MARKNVKTREGVYERTDRPGFWISWTDAQGRRKRRKTDASNITQAKAALAAEKARVEHAKTLGFTPPGEETFAEIAVRFLQYQKARLTPAAYERERGIVAKSLKPFFAGKIASIRRQDAQRFVTERSGIVAAETIKKELNVLKHLLKLAMEWEFIPINPAQGVKSPPVPAGRVRYLQPTELKGLLEACPDWLRPIVGLAVATGMRRGEILDLRWMNVDLANKRILLPQTKNGSSRIVYLNEMSMMVLTSLPFNERSLTIKVFSDVTPEQVSMRFSRICTSLKITDFRFHDLRHTAASWLRMKGADIHTVAMVLGHKDLRMTARYSHLSPGYMAEAMSKLDDAFGEIRHHSVTNEKALTDKKPVSA